MKRTALLFSIFMLSTSAIAMTLAETKQYKAWKDFFASDEGHATFVKTNCGKDVPVTLDEKFVTPFMKAGSNAASFCDEALSTIGTMCQDATAKPMVIKAISKLSCKLGKDDKVDIKLSNGEMTFTFNKDSSNLSEKVKTFLENNLQ